MPYIKVNTDKIKTYTTELEASRIAINRIRERIKELRYSLDWDVRYSSTIDRRIEQIIGEMNIEANTTTKMRNFLNAAVSVYNQQSETIESASRDMGDEVIDGVRLGVKIAGYGVTATEKIKDFAKFLDNWSKGKKITYTMKKGQMFLKGYERASGLTSRYNFGTWIKKGAKDGMKFNIFDKISLGLDILEEGVNLTGNLYNVWTDENKSTEKKVCDTIAHGYGAVASTAINVGGVIVGKAAAGAVAAACCAIPVVGPALGVVAGAATGVIVEGAIGVIADTMTSEAVVSRVSDAAENIYGTCKASVAAVSDAAKAIAEEKTILGKAAKTAELVSTTVTEVAKVAVTTVVESVKTSVTVAVETAKNVGKAVANFFKGW